MALSQSVPPPERGDLQGSAFACLDFINSGWRDHRDGVREYDLLPSPEWQRKFRRRWALELEDGAAEPPLRRLLWARAALRSVLESWASGRRPATADLATLNRILARGPTVRRLEIGAGALSLRVEAARRDWNWVLAEVVASAAALAAAGPPARLKVCGNDHCTWLFWDGSHNLSRRWCDAATCGNLVKVRSFRQARKQRS